MNWDFKFKPKNNSASCWGGGGDEQKMFNATTYVPWLTLHFTFIQLNQTWKI